MPSLHGSNQQMRLSDCHTTLRRERWRSTQAAVVLMAVAQVNSMTSALKDVSTEKVAEKSRELCGVYDRLDHDLMREVVEGNKLMEKVVKELTRFDCKLVSFMGKCLEETTQLLDKVTTSALNTMESGNFRKLLDHLYTEDTVNLCIAAWRQLQAQTLRGGNDSANKNSQQDVIFNGELWTELQDPVRKLLSIKPAMIQDWENMIRQNNTAIAQFHAKHGVNHPVYTVSLLNKESLDLVLQLAESESKKLAQDLQPIGQRYLNSLRLLKYTIATDNLAFYNAVREIARNSQASQLPSEDTVTEVMQVFRFLIEAVTKRNVVTSTNLLDETPLKVAALFDPSLPNVLNCTLNVNNLKSIREFTHLLTLSSEDLNNKKATVKEEIKMFKLAAEESKDE